MLHADVPVRLGDVGPEERAEPRLDNLQAAVRVDAAYVGLYMSERMDGGNGRARTLASKRSATYGARL